MWDFWAIYQYCQSADEKFAKEKKWRRYVLLILRLVPLAAAIATAVTFTNYFSGYTAVIKGPVETCSSAYALPTILMCPKPIRNRTYGVVMREHLVDNYNLTATEIDLLSEWQMTGRAIPTTQATELFQKVKRHGFASLQLLWKALTNTDLDKKEWELGRVYYICATPYAHKGSADTNWIGGPECNLTIYQKNGIECPGYDQSEYSTNVKRRIWHTDLRSRCVFIEQNTHPFSESASVLFGVGNSLWKAEHIVYPFYSWVGDFNVDEIKHLIEENKENSAYSLETVLYKTNIPKPRVCHPELVYDLGEQMPCNEGEMVPQHYITSTTLRDLGVWDLSGIHFSVDHGSLTFEDTPSFSNLALIQLIFGVIDIYTGFSLYQIFLWMVQNIKTNRKLMKVIVLILKLAVHCSFLIVATVILLGEWKFTLVNWYSNKFSVNDNEDLVFPSMMLKFIYVAEPLGKFNFTKLMELGVSIPLLEFIMITGASKNLLQLPFLGSGQIALMHDMKKVDLKIDECLKNRAAGLNCSAWEDVNYFLSFVHSPYSSEYSDPIHKAIRFAYGKRYESVTDYVSLRKVLFKEYRDLKKALRLNDNSLPVDVYKKLIPDLCELITSCQLNSVDIKNCCHLFQIAPGGMYIYDYDYLFINNGAKIPVLFQGHSGITSGLKMKINMSAFMHFTDIRQYNGGITEGIQFSANGFQPQISITFYPDNQDYQNQHTKHYTSTSLLSHFTDSMSSGTWTIGLQLYTDEKLQDINGCSDFSNNTVGSKCAASQIYHQTVIKEKCGCQICNELIDGNRPVWSEHRCCLAEELFDCIMSKESYSKHCTHVGGGTSGWGCETKDPPYRNMFLIGRCNEQSFPPMDQILLCNWTNWTKEDENAPLRLTDVQLENLNKQLAWDVWDTEKKEFNPCPELCKSAFISNVQSSLERGGPGLATVNIFYATLNTIDTQEYITFNLWKFIAVIFGSWSLFYNTPFTLIIANFLTLLIKLWQLYAGKIGFYAFIGMEGNVPNEELQPGPTVNLTENNENEPSPSNSEKIKETSSRQNPRLRQESLSSIKQLGSDTVNVQATGKNQVIEEIPKNKWIFLRSAYLLFFIGLLLAAGQFLIQEVMKEPYSVSMNASISSFIALPSVAFCMKLQDKHEIEQGFKDSLFDCFLLRKKVNCENLFYLHVQQNNQSCVVANNAEINANDKYSWNDAVYKDDFQLEVIERVTLSPSALEDKSINIWLGDIASLTGPKKIEPLFVWKGSRSTSILFIADKRVEPSSVCHHPETTKIQCTKCEKPLLDHDHQCCGSHAQSVPQLVGHYRKTPPCVSFQYLAWEGDKPEVEGVKRVLRVKKHKSLLITHITSDRITWQGVFILLGTYWGMFLGLPVYILLVIVAHGVLRCWGCIAGKNTVAAEHQPT